MQGLVNKSFCQMKLQQLDPSSTVRYDGNKIVSDYRPFEDVRRDNASLEVASVRKKIATGGNYDSDRLFGEINLSKIESDT